MGKKRTLKKQDFSLNSIKPVQLKKGLALEKHSPKESLKDPDFVYKALMDALKEGDSQSFKLILSAHLEVINKEAFSKRAQIPKRTLFRILSPEGNPTLDNVAKLVHALKAA